MSAEVTDWKPQDIGDEDVAFPDNVTHLMPAMPEIPDEFKRSSGPWVDWQNRWFFRGLDAVPKAKAGIDCDKAIRHLSAIQRSFQPKHEHKSAAVAYLASLWFESPNGRGA